MLARAHSRCLHSRNLCVNLHNVRPIPVKYLPFSLTALAIQLTQVLPAKGTLCPIKVIAFACFECADNLRFLFWCHSSFIVHHHGNRRTEHTSRRVLGAKDAHSGLVEPG